MPCVPLRSFTKKRKKKVVEERTTPVVADLTCFGLEDITIEVPDESKEVAVYCIPLVAAQFNGQTCCSDEKVY